MADVQVDKEKINPEDEAAIVPFLESLVGEQPEIVIQSYRLIKDYYLNSKMHLSIYPDG